MVDQPVAMEKSTFLLQKIMGFKLLSSIARTLTETFVFSYTDL